MRDMIKDIISFFIYAAVTPFYGGRKATLVYHSVDDVEPGKDPYKMNVPPSVFEEHMRYICERKDLYTVTFDDGFRSVYTRAFPVLKKYGMKAVLFLTTDYIDARIKLDRFFANRYSPGPLKWDEIKEMASYGITIASHAVTHKNMACLDEKKAFLEASASKGRIMDMTGRDTVYFSYPFGNSASFNKGVKKMLKGLGYERAYTNIMGMDNSAACPYAINRIRIYGTDRGLKFMMKIRGAYNWVDLVARTRMDRTFEEVS